MVGAERERTHRFFCFTLQQGLLHSLRQDSSEVLEQAKAFAEIIDFVAFKQVKTHAAATSPARKAERGRNRTVVCVHPLRHVLTFRAVRQEHGQVFLVSWLVHAETAVDFCPEYKVRLPSPA